MELSKGGTMQFGQEAVDATSINAFKSKLDRLRCVTMGFFMD